MQPDVARNIVLGIVGIMLFFLVVVGLIGFAGYRALEKKGMVEIVRARESFEKKDYAGAEKLLTQAIEKGANSEIAYYMRGQCYLFTSKYALAADDFSSAIKLHQQQPEKDGPNITGEYHASRGIAYAFNGNWEKAQEDFTKMEKSAPNDKYLFNNTAWALATCPDTRPEYAPRALALAKKANALALGRDSVILDTLAAAQAATGDFENAIKNQQEAINLQDEPKHKEEYIAHLKLYKEGKVYHEPLGK